MRRLLLRIAVTVTLLGPALAQAGYGYGGYCWATLSEAVGVYAQTHWGTSQGRILSYTPVSGAVQVIWNNQISAMAIVPCDPVITTDLFGASPMPWYGSDPGTVSACGSTVQTVGGVAGSGGGGSASLAGWSMTAEEGARLGVAIAGVFALAAVFRLMGRMGTEKDEE